MLTASRRPMDRPALGLLAAGHLSVDLCQGAVPAMLPFLIHEHHLSYTAAAGLVLAQTASSSILQPLFGQLSDRRSAPWLMPLGVALGGIGLAAAALLPTYELVWLAIAVSGLGIAAYHPDGARYTSYAAGRRQATGMSIFALGGNAGFASGPVLATPLLLWLGLRGGWAIAAVPLLVALALSFAMRRLEAHRRWEGPREAVSGRGADRWGPFARVSGAQVCRSILFYGLNTFVPLYWIGVLRQPTGAGGAALATLLVVGFAGTLLGGRLAEHVPWRSIVAGSFVLSGPCLLALIAFSAPLPANAMLVPLGLCLYAPSGVMVLLAQEYLPSRVGTASGVILGLAISVGGMVTPLLGLVADRAGLQATMLVLVVVSALAAALALSLPRADRAPGRARAGRES